MNELFDAIREAAGPSIWSAGVELTRQDAVTGEAELDGEVRLSIRAPNGPKRFKVQLFLDDEDWTCTCGTKHDACSHVAAAVIALRQARKSGKRLPGTSERWSIHYAFTSASNDLHLKRELVSSSGDRTPLGLSVSKAASERELLTDDADLSVEALLGSRTRGALPRSVLEKLFRLVRDRPTTLDDAPVEIGGVQTGMRAVVEDVPTGVRVRLEQDPKVRRLFRNGALLVDETLCALAEPTLSGERLRALRNGMLLDTTQMGELVSTLIPELERSVPVDVRSSNLPRARKIKPRIELKVVPKGRKTSVLATLVYGDPPVARVDGDQISLLGDGPAPVRDRQSESALMTRLRAELNLEPGVRVDLSTNEALTLGVRADASTLRLADIQALDQVGSLIPALDFTADGFQTRFAVGGNGSADGRVVLEAWMAGERFVPLLDGAGIAELPRDWLDRYGHRVADLLASRRDDGTLPPASRVEAASLFNELDTPASPELSDLLHQLDTPPSLPSDLTATLRPYQLEAVAWLSGLKATHLGGLLADDMGLGKTLQAICTLEENSLVVCPTSVIENWRREIERFRPTLSVNTYHGRSRALDESHVTLTTYALMRLDIETLATREWNVVVLDESQAIKNPDSQAARAAHQLQSKFRLTLTGTPVENRLEELWSQMNFANPGLLGERKWFDNHYTKPIADGDQTTADRLQRRLRPFVRRRLKREVAPELPPRTDLVLRCDLGEEERAAYDAIRVATQREIVERMGHGLKPLDALESLLRLRQAACHLGLLPNRSAATSSKLQLLTETLDEALVAGHKALVFSQWTSLLDLLEPTLTERGRRYLRLDGSSKDRGALVDRFQNESGPDLMLISLKAGGTGLNLTAADYVFLLDPWWNPAVEDQAADRAHRIGQERPVFVHRLVARDTVEEKILTLQEKKRALANAAVGNAALASNLTRDELMDLLA